MPRPPGRDQTAPMERLVRIIGALNQRSNGVPLRLLLQATAPESAGDEARRRMLNRDIEQLNNLGYDIRNVADAGAEGVYVMRARDNRLQVFLDAPQRGELLRAALAAGLTDVSAHLADGEAVPAGAEDATGPLDLAQRAVSRRCRVRFLYKGQQRDVHPAGMHSGPSGWYLAGREERADDAGNVKQFVVSRMSEVSLDAPGTATAVVEVPRASLDPLRWHEDPPTDVVIEVPSEHRRLTENLLGVPLEVLTGGGGLRMTYLVTNRAVFRWRIYELGVRVRVIGPDDVRRELLDELTAVTAGA